MRNPPLDYKTLINCLHKWAIFAAVTSFSQFMQKKLFLNTLNDRWFVSSQSLHCSYRQCIAANGTPRKLQVKKINKIMNVNMSIYATIKCLKIV